MSDEGSRTCPYCHEAVRSAARKCPHCHQWLGRWLGNPGLPVALMILFMACMFFWLDRATTRAGGENFLEHRDELVVSQSSVHFSRSEGRTFVSTVGRIRNDRPFAWDDVYIEVQYFDEAGDLIDTEGGEQYGLTVLPGAEVAFRLRAEADKPEAAYVSHKVSIPSARDARSLF